MNEITQEQFLMELSEILSTNWAHINRSTASRAYFWMMLQRLAEDSFWKERKNNLLPGEHYNG